MRDAPVASRARAIVVGILLLWLESGAAAQSPMHDRIKAMKPGEWLELTTNATGTISGTKLERVFPKREGHPAWAVSGAYSVMSAWSGCAFDTRRDLLICNGGGHNDYGGNEVYGFSLRTLEWSRMTEPSHMEALDAQGHTYRTVDGAPVSRHTYDTIEYIASIDRVVVVGGSLYRVGYAYDRHIWAFDSERRKWEQKAIAPATGLGGSAYDPVTDGYYVNYGPNFIRYAPTTDSWTVVARDADIADGTAEIDPLERTYVYAAQGALWLYNIGRNPVARQQARTGGDKEIERASRIGLAYDPVGRRILAWAGDEDVYSLDVKSLQWKKHQPQGGGAPRSWRLNAKGERWRTHPGIYGRWRYVPSLDRFVGVNWTGDNVWLYRPPREQY